MPGTASARDVQNPVLRFLTGSRMAFAATFRANNDTPTQWADGYFLNHIVTRHDYFLSQIKIKFSYFAFIFPQGV